MDLTTKPVLIGLWGLGSFNVWVSLGSSSRVRSFQDDRLAANFLAPSLAVFEASILEVAWASANFGGVDATPMAWADQPLSVNLTLPPLSVILLRRDGDAETPTGD